MILNNDYILININTYKLLNIIIFIICSITLNLIEVSKFKNKVLKINNQSTKVLIGTFLVISLITLIGSFAIVFSNYIKYGNIVLYVSSIFSVLLMLYLLKKFKVDKFHIINTYISISFIGLALAFIPTLRLIACFFLAFGLVSYNMCVFLGNTLYDAYKYKFIIPFVILTNILIPILTTWTFKYFENNVQSPIIIFFLIITIFFIILFTIMPFVSSEYKTDMTNKKLTKYSDTLSKRENEIVKYILLGYTSGQLSDELYISLPTVKTHISNIYKKLNINSKKELFQLFYK